MPNDCQQASIIATDTKYCTTNPAEVYKRISSYKFPLMLIIVF